MGFNTLTYIFVISILQSILNTTDGQSRNTTFREDYTYLGDVEGYYKIHTARKNWLNAKKECALEGATLFYPENEKEATEVINLWTRTQPQFKVLYIGISDLLTEGVFETIHGRPIADVYNKWDDGEPNSYNEYRHCVVIQKNGHLNLDSCDNFYPFICKKAVKDLQLQEPKDDNQQITRFFRKDYTFLNPTESFYKIHSDLTNWSEAKRRCTLEGATLFYPENEYETREVLQFWKERQPRVDFIYVGTSDLVQNGFFETIDGRPLDDVYRKWAPGEPNNFGGQEHCLVLQKDSKLNDDHCDGIYTYICKKTYKDIQWDERCNLPKSMGYVYNADLGRCYKFHTEPKTWTEALKECRNEKSYLAVINSQEEADFFAEFSSYYKKGEIAETYLGFHNRFRDGWRTVKGESLADAGYSSWVPGKPDDEDIEECGSMSFNQQDQADNGKLSQLYCEERNYYICEHELSSNNQIDNRFYRL